MASADGDSGDESLSPIERLLTERTGRGGEALEVAEILAAAQDGFESLFREPPLGPIPDYLEVHWRVYGCVGELEESVEQLDRWKVLQIERWLQERVGRRWRIDGQVYELRAVKGDGPSSVRDSARSCDA